ncbi:glycosyltransferase, partial [Candidatus Woesearchaeota archaeon]|nr:glycosyltransferase [Candidatus Woesearchaeota archaeon]
SHVKIIKFRKNFGQTAAWDAGFRNSRGTLVVTLDADLQNDPKDIPQLIAKLNQGYDVVSGWRHRRKDSFTKKFFSGISRFLRKRIIDDNIHDSGCSLKVYKRECLDDLYLTGEMHRYITEMLVLRGFRIGEVKVNHSPRKHGRTKYNFVRLPKGFLDLLIIAFWQKYSSRPIHIFGIMGFLLAVFGFVLGVFSLYLKVFQNQDLTETFVPMLAILSVIIGVQFLVSGILADIAIKTYYRGEKKNYYVEKIY